MTPNSSLTFDGQTQPITEWALDYGIPAGLIVSRLNAGMSIEKAITKPMLASKGMRLAEQPVPKAKPTPKDKLPKKAPRDLKLYTFEDRSLTLTQWGAHLGIEPATLFTRVKKGWPIEKVLTFNQRDTRQHFDHNGESLTIPQWCARTGLLPATLWARVRKGMTFAEAITYKRPVARKPEPRKLDTLTFNGQTRTIREWADHTGNTVNALRLRLLNGWPLERALGPAIPKSEANTASARRYTHNGQTLTIKEWAKLAGMRDMTLRRRLDRGVPIAKAIIPPDPATRYLSDAKRYAFRGEHLTPSQWAFRFDMNPSTVIRRLERGLSIAEALSPGRVQNVGARKDAQRFTHNGQTLTIKEWGERIGLSEGTIHQRLRTGMDLTKALTSPNMRPRAGGGSKAASSRPDRRLPEARDRGIITFSLSEASPC